jgi:hypothetical protein
MQQPYPTDVGDEEWALIAPSKPSITFGIIAPPFV